MPYIDVHTNLLDIDRVPDLVGKEARDKAREYYNLLEETLTPLYLIGDSGTSKTATMKWLAKAWSKKHDVPAYYHRLSKSDSKTATILGLRMIDGSLVVTDGLLARAARQRAFVALDEIGHTTEDMLLMLDAFEGSASVITIGDEIIDAAGMPIVYGSNAGYAGNIQVPQSFLNRVYTLKLDYPKDMQDEIDISIAVALRDSRTGDISHVPYSVIQYIVATIRELRKPGEFPLSVRDVSKAILYLEMEAKRAKHTSPDPYFTRGTEAVQRRISRRILGRETTDAMQLAVEPIKQFIEFASKISVQKMREILLSSFGYYADSVGLGIDNEPFRQTLYSETL